jgi:hypothetical protein
MNKFLQNSTLMLYWPPWFIYPIIGLFWFELTEQLVLCNIF